jgi:hypothetical protein
MAEILGISAAVVQFLDIAVRLSLKLGSVYKDLQDVPCELQRLKGDIDQQINVARYIQSSHAPFWASLQSNSAVASSVDETLTGYMALMDELLDILKSVANKDDTGPVRRSWNAVRAVHKHRSILAICENLEKKKSSVNL